MENSVLLFIIFIVIIGMIYLSSYEVTTNNDKFFKINGKKYKFSKIYKSTNCNGVYVEKDDHEKTDQYNNYICNNFKMLNINKDIYLLERL